MATQEDDPFLLERAVEVERRAEDTSPILFEKKADHDNADGHLPKAERSLRDELMQCFLEWTCHQSVALKLLSATTQAQLDEACRKILTALERRETSLSQPISSSSRFGKLPHDSTSQTFTVKGTDIHKSAYMSCEGSGTAHGNELPRTQMQNTKHTEVSGEIITSGKQAAGHFPVSQQSTNDLSLGVACSDALQPPETEKSSSEGSDSHHIWDEAIGFEASQQSSQRRVITPFRRSSTLTDISDWRSAIKTTILEKTHVSCRFSAIMERIQALEAKAKVNRERCLYRFVLSGFFTSMCAFLIFANALWLGYEVDQREASERGWRKWVSVAFNVCFMLELALRMIALRADFIFGSDKAWNILDVFCVLLSIPDFFSTAVNVSFVRIIRVGKVAKGLRLIRVLEFVTSLRFILTTVFWTLGSLCWSFVAMVFVAYIAAILLQQALVLHRDDGVQFSDNTTNNFKNVWSSMLALLSMITGGQEWYEFAQDFEAHGAYAAKYGLLIWIFFMLFGLVNVVVAVFCAQAVDAGTAHSDLRLQKEAETRAAKISELMSIFNMIDSETRGIIGWDQFHRFARSTEGQSILESNGLQLFAVRDLWQIMQEYNEMEAGEVDISAFVMGFMRLGKESIATDVVMLSCKVKRLHHDMTETLQVLRRDLSKNIALPTQQETGINGVGEDFHIQTQNGSGSHKVRDYLQVQSERRSGIAEIREELQVQSQPRSGINISL